MDLYFLFDQFVVKLLIMWILLMLVDYICDHREIQL